MISFASLAVLGLVLELWKRKSEPKSVVSNPGFLAFRNNYLVVYSLMMGAGPIRCP